MEGGALVKTLFQDNPTKPDYRYIYIMHHVLGFYLHYAEAQMDFLNKISLIINW